MSHQYNTRRRLAFRVGSQWYRDDGFFVRDLAARYGKARIDRAVRALKINIGRHELLSAREAQMLIVWVFMEAGGKLKL